MSDGRIVERGTHFDLAQKQNGGYASLIRTFHCDQSETSKELNGSCDDVISGTVSGVTSSVSELTVEVLKNEKDESEGKKYEKDGEIDEEEDGKLIEKETVERGQVTSDTYLAYFK